MKPPCAVSIFIMATSSFFRTITIDNDNVDFFIKLLNPNEEEYDMEELTAEEMAELEERRIHNPIDGERGEFDDE